MYVHRVGVGEERQFLGIHGWGGGWATFSPLEPYLPPDVSIWAVDLPGYGDSPPPQRWCWEHVADQVAEAVSALPAPLTLLGNCAGAAFGLAVVQRAPERFASLVLIDPFAYFPWYFSLLTTRAFYAAAFENPLGRWFTNRGLAARRGPGSDLTASFGGLNHDVVHAYLRMMRRMPAYEAARSIDLPVTLLYGERTFVAVRRSVRLWRELWPHARAVEIVGAGHLPIEEAPAELARHAF